MKPGSAVNMSRTNVPVPVDESTSYFFSFSSDIVRRVNMNTEYQIPHVEWNGTEFVIKDPQPLPALQITVHPMLATHNEISNVAICDVDVNAFVTITAFTDTCAQTCVSGMGLLHRLKFS